MGNKINQIKSTITNNPSFTVKEQMGYAAGIFGNCMGQDSVGTFSNKFFRNFMGVENDKVTLMQNIQSIVLFLLNPVMGNILDRPTKPGKRPASKKILMYTPLPFAITSMLLFVVPSSSSFYNFIWALVLKLAFGIVDGFYDMSLNTMSLRMTNNANDRKNFYTLATFASALGSMLPGWLIPMIVGRTNDANLQKWLYFFIALVFCVLGVSSMFAPYFTLNEKIRVAPRSKESIISWDKDTIIAVLHNRTFIINQTGNFFEKIRSCSYELLVYLYEDVMGDLSMKAIIDVISGTLSYAGLASVPFITKRLSARSVLSLGYGYTGFFYLLIGLFGIGFKVDKVRKYRYLIGIMIGLAGMPNNAISAAKKVVVGDSTDYMEWYSVKRFGKPIHSEGLIYTVQGICNQVFSLVVMNIYNPLFKTIGYKESIIKKGEQKAVQSDSTLRGLFLMFALFGIIGNFLAALTYQFDNYTGKRREAILEELKEMRLAQLQAEQSKEADTPTQVL